MLVMGVDENGLGPRLGPLVATSVVLEASRYARAALCERGLGLGLTDSKETGGFGRMAFTESVALALLDQGGAGLPASVDDFLDRVAPRSRPTATGLLSGRSHGAAVLGGRPLAADVRRECG